MEDPIWQAARHADHADRRAAIIGSLRREGFQLADEPADAVKTAARRTANQLGNCCRYPKAFQDRATGEIIRVAGRCNHRACPLCGPLRAAELQRGVLRATAKMDQMRFLTLTIVSTDDPLAKRIDHLRQSFSRLRRQKAWKNHVKGGVVTVEVTWNPRTQQWHPHLHMLIDGTYFPSKAIKAAWQEATGDSDIVHISRPAGRFAAAAYVAKYASKGMDFPTAPDRRIAEWNHAIRSVRLAQTFGSLHGSKTTDEKIERPDGTEEIAPLGPLIDAVHGGEKRAERLATSLRLISGRGLSDPRPRSPEVMLASHRRTARRLRSWWSNRQESYRGFATNRPPDSAVRNRPDHRPLWLWEEPDDPASVVRYGLPESGRSGSARGRPRGHRAVAKAWH